MGSFAKNSPPNTANLVGIPPQRLPRAGNVDFSRLVLGFAALAARLCISVHSREMFVRKATNYEKVLEVQCQNTNDLISKLVPYHQVENLKNEKKQVDEYDDATLLFTDIEGSTRLLSELRSGYIEALAEHRHVIREAAAAHGGVEVDTQGDSFLLAFSRPSGAVAAAVAAQRGLPGGPGRPAEGAVVSHGPLGARPNNPRTARLRVKYQF